MAGNRIRAICAVREIRRIAPVRIRTRAIGGLGGPCPREPPEELRRHEQHHGREQQPQRTLGQGIGQRDAARHAQGRQGSYDRAVAQRDIAVAMLARRSDQCYRDDGEQRRGFCLYLAERQHERQRRHEQDPAADAEQSADGAGRDPHDRRDNHVNTRSIATPIISRANRSEMVSVATRCWIQVPRSAPATLSLDALAPLRQDPARAAILLDIDGTLAPIVDLASDARVPERTRQLLAEVAKRYGVVACVSGRRASEARAMVSVGTISYLGSHGAELLRAGWTQPVLDENVAHWARRVQEFGREADTAELRRQRVRIEDKGLIVAFHWRGAPDEDAARAGIDAIAARAESAGLRTHWGRKVLEVRPPVRIDKGVGISTFLAEEDGDI